MPDIVVYQLFIYDMNTILLLQKSRNLETWRLLVIITIVVPIIVGFQFFSLPYRNYVFSPSSIDNGSALVMVGSTTIKNSSRLHITNGSDFEKEDGYDYEMEVKGGGGDFPLDDDSSFAKETVGKADMELKFEGIALDKGSMMTIIANPVNRDQYNSTMREVQNPDTFQPVDANSSTSNSFVSTKMPSVDGAKQAMETKVESRKTQDINSTITEILLMNRRRTPPTTISEMNSLLLQSLVSPSSMRPRWSSARDRELISAKLQIINAPFVKNIPELDSSIFHNISVFKRSYDLMERVLKVYVYREGEKPIFHQPKRRGIYASEGWFIKSMEGNKQFVVKDPRKAHIFFLPFSSRILRSTIMEQSSLTSKDLEKYLQRYVDLIARKYRFWNRTDGADHFLVACHDWAPKLTNKPMGKCIRALCNSNLGSGFKVGKDSTLPVTYIRQADHPMKDLGGKPASERSILAFFAGGMHGYVRPILLHYWENKEPDMKILGPMARDDEGKAKYRMYMKNSKYCICAKGYEVHTPRVVEAIFYECVPVIISDNYVPPFLEVLDWEAFSVFVLEKDIPNLRNILVSIPEEKYLVMQRRVKMVQRHFLWHQKAVKYDLFHMILHSVWHNRVFQFKPR